MGELRPPRERPLKWGSSDPRVGGVAVDGGAELTDTGGGGGAAAWAQTDGCGRAAAQAARLWACAASVLFRDAFSGSASSRACGLSLRVGGGDRAPRLGPQRLEGGVRFTKPHFLLREAKDVCGCWAHLSPQCQFKPSCLAWMHEMASYKGSANVREAMHCEHGWATGPGEEQGPCHPTGPGP